MSKIARSLNSIKIYSILTNMFGLKSTGKSKIPILSTWGLGLVLNRFYIYLSPGHILIRKKCPFHFTEFREQIERYFRNKVNCRH